MVAVAQGRPLGRYRLGQQPVLEATHVAEGKRAVHGQKLPDGLPHHQIVGQLNAGQIGFGLKATGQGVYQALAHGQLDVGFGGVPGHVGQAGGAQGLG